MLGEKKNNAENERRNDAMLNACRRNIVSMEGRKVKVILVIVSDEALFNAAISADSKRILPGEGLDFLLVDGC